MLKLKDATVFDLDDGPKFRTVSTLEDLGGKEIYVNPFTMNYQNLQRANETLQRASKPPIVIKAADKNLFG